MKIIWAIDAFEKGEGCQRAVLEALKTLENKTKIEIEPVYVLSPDQLQVPVELTTPWLEQYKPAAEKAVAGILQGLDLKSVCAPTILIQKESSLSRSIAMLSAHAKAKNADLIITGSHSRTGINRILLGSFAETLATHSDVPVLVLGQDGQITKSINWDSILFATDFSEASQKAFDLLLPLAKGLGAKIKLLHAIVNPIEPVFQSGVFLMGGGWVPVSMFFEQQIQKQTQVGKTWVEKATAKGVQIELKIDSEASSVMECILDNANQIKPSIIALASESGPVASVLLGSISRSILNQSKIPVWIIKK